MSVEPRQWRLFFFVFFCFFLLPFLFTASQRCCQQICIYSPSDLVEEVADVLSSFTLLSYHSPTFCFSFFAFFFPVIAPFHRLQGTSASFWFRLPNGFLKNYFSTFRYIFLLFSLPVSPVKPRGRKKEHPKRKERKIK